METAFPAEVRAAGPDACVVALGGCLDVRAGPALLLAHNRTRSPSRERAARLVALDAGGPGGRGRCRARAPGETFGLEPGSPFTVNRFLQSSRHPEVFAAGDFATVDSRDALANPGERPARRLPRGPGGREPGALRDRAPPAPVSVPPIGEMIGFGDFDGVGVLHGFGVRGAAAAAAKKANEVKYLAGLYRDLPGALGRSVLSGARKGATA